MRYTDWQKRFWAEVDRQREMPFVWGERDCVLSAAMLADAVSDESYVSRAKASFSWRNAREAAELLQSADLLTRVESVLGPLRPWPSLNMADIALIVDDDGRQSLGSHDGVQIIGPVEIGMQPIPFRCVKGGWHVT